MYEKILEHTLAMLEKVALAIPESGELAGAGMRIADSQAYKEAWHEDNYHFPLGTAYLSLGFGGVAENAQKKAEMSGGKQAELFYGIAKSYCALSELLKRYAEKIHACANGEARLERIAERLGKIAFKAPEHFDEALQSVALMWCIRTLNADGADIGRLDVHLKEFFDRDIASGYMTEEKCLDLLCDFWRILNSKCTGDTLNNVLVGGKQKDGTNAGGRLSVLMLEATKRCAMPEPHINVRVFEGLDNDIRRAMTKVQLMGQGQATVYNDDVLIDSLIKFGIPEDLAYNYTNDGCTEVVLDGGSGIDFEHIDAVAAFELGFNNGSLMLCDYRRPIKYWSVRNIERLYTPDVITGFESGEVEKCSDFGEFYNCFLRQYEFQVKSKAEKLEKMEENRKSSGCSSLLLNGTLDCVFESGKDCISGGFPVALYMMFSGSIPTVADCLIAIKKVVFEQKRYTIAEIKDALRADFKGYEGMQKELLSAPKFGNGIDEVDMLAADIADRFCDWLDEYRSLTGFAVMPALLGWRFLEEAHGIAATPDGRNYADPIAEHYCATPGKAVNGPTAHISSIAKAKKAISRAVGVSAVHMTLPSGIQKSENGKEIIDGLVRSACASGLSQMNIAVYDADTLRKAQAEPEKYQDIVVRVWGYSARFVSLCKEMQEHVISRISN